MLSEAAEQILVNLQFFGENVSSGSGWSPIKRLWPPQKKIGGKRGEVEVPLDTFW